MTINTYHSRALIARVAVVLAVGLMALVGPKPAWAAETNFAPTQHFSVGSSPTTVTNADFNGDGKVDLAAQNYRSNTVSVLTGNGEGTFDPKQDFTVGTNPSSVIGTDLDGDAKADLAVANYSSNTVSVLLGNGDGTFQTAQPYSVSVGGDAPTRSSPTTSMETETLISRPRTRALIQSLQGTTVA